MVFVDGSFTPRPYVQFFTIHGEINDHVLKLVCGLLSATAADVYEEALRAVANRIQATTNQQCVVREIVSDYEAAIIAAADRIWPGVDIHGCYFHFTQAIWKDGNVFNG